MRTNSQTYESNTTGLFEKTLQPMAATGMSTVKGAWYNEQQNQSRFPMATGNQTTTAGALPQKLLV